MPTSPTKCSQNKRNQQTNQQRKHQEAATTSSPTLEELLKKIGKLEDKVAELESELIVTRNVNELLSQEVDDLQQHQRRASVTLDRITPSEHETTEEITKKAKNVMVKNLNFSEEEVDIELDKCHRLGPTRDGKQSTIVRFRLHVFKEKVYQKRKEIKRKKIKVKLSLTKHRTKTIKHAHQITENNAEVKLLYADMNGNLKLRPHNSIGNKYIYKFKSKEELHELFNKFDWENPELHNQI